LARQQIELEFLLCDRVEEARLHLCILLVDLALRLYALLVVMRILLQH
jgi:hypothetical protein